jgi:DNA-binding NtrC family response regulator
MDALHAYGWPGNVRELENVVERALILTRGSILRLDESFRVGSDRVVISGTSDPRRLDSVEHDHILQVLIACGWRINGPGNAADQLGLHPTHSGSR